jgi:hypothetical protein
MEQSLAADGLAKISIANMQLRRTPVFAATQSTLCLSHLEAFCDL